MDYDYHWSNTVIKKTIIELNDDSKVMTEEDIYKKYKEFRDKYKGLFDLIIEEGLTKDTMTRMNDFFSKRDTITSKDTAFKAHVQMGHQYAVEFFPKEHQPTKEEYNKALNDIKEGRATPFKMEKR